MPSMRGEFILKEPLFCDGSIGVGLSAFMKIFRFEELVKLSKKHL
jgi:hypothetical protein